MNEKRLICAYLKAHPEISSREISDGTGIELIIVRQKLMNMGRSGVVVRTMGNGQVCHYQLAEDRPYGDYNPLTVLFNQCLRDVQSRGHSVTDILSGAGNNTSSYKTEHPENTKLH